MTMPVTSIPTTRRSPARAVSLYTALSRDIRDRGLLNRRHGYYLIRIGTAVAAFAAVWAGVVMIGDSWFQLLAAAALGIVLTQFGFLGHDAAHRQIFTSPAGNQWTARLLSGGFIGLSYGWWQTKHSRHHAAPNQAGRDPDISPGVLAFTPEIAQARTGWAGWLTRRQGWLFFPLLTLEGLNLHVSSVRQVLRPRSMPHQWVEGALVLARLAGYVTVLLLLLPPGKAGAFFGLQMALFGIFMGGSFAPNHKGMPIAGPAAKIDFLRRQVLMSRNISGGMFTDFVMGGLNYQIEHHLFPSMPRPNLKLTQPIVRAYCAQHNVAYTEVGLLRSYAIVTSYLNRVGLRDRDPFECHLVAAYRD